MKGGKRKRQNRRKEQTGLKTSISDSTFAADAEFRKHGLWAVDNFNGNTWASAAPLLDASAADYIALQEVKEVGD